MKYYVDNQGVVYAFAADGSEDSYIPAGATLITEAEALELAKPKLDVEQVWELIKRKRSAHEQGGVLVSGKWFHSDADSRIKYLGLLLSGNNIPANLQWKTMDGSFVTMTKALVDSIFAALVQQDTLIYQVAEQHKVALEASADPTKYDFSTGWPATFTA